MTLPPFGILIKKEHRTNTALIDHELVHWKQFQRMGLLPFISTYVREQLKGYDQNALEIEARYAESEYCKTNYTQCVRNGSATTIHNPNFRI